MFMKLMMWRRFLKVYNYLRCNDVFYFLCLSFFILKGKVKFYSNIFFNDMKLVLFYKIIVKFFFIGMKIENERFE